MRAYMKRFAILLALLAMPAIVGCGSSEAKTASASSKNAKKKPKKKSKKPKPGNTHPKGYKPPQNVWGPLMLEDALEGLSSSDPKKRETACNGLFNQRSRAREALPELKRLVKKEKDKKVLAAAKRAIKAIEEG
jgi:hypothetical protein